MATRVVAAPTVLQQTCSQIALASSRQHARWRLVCPPVVPWQAIPAPEAFGLLTANGFRVGYTIDSADAGGRMAWHWTFESGNPNLVARDLTVKNALGEPQVIFTESHATIGGQPVSVYHVTGGVCREGLPPELILGWTEHGQGYQVGLYRSLSDRQTYSDATRMAAAIIRIAR